MKNLVTMIDYGIGNYRSVQKALEHVGGKIVLQSDPDAIAKADKLILPGVGAFGAAINALRERNIDDAIYAAVEQGSPLLGICVGMQLLLDSSNEFGFHRGLGLIEGHVERLPDNVFKVPHIGWNQLYICTPSPLVAKLGDEAYAYFVHSYKCQPKNASDLIATTDYGGEFASIIGRNNIFGIQFHAEKSQKVGLQILRNFVAL